MSWKFPHVGGGLEAQISGTEPGNRPTHTCPTDFWQRCKSSSMEERLSFFPQMFLEQLDICREKKQKKNKTIDLDLNLLSYTEINSKWVTVLTIKCKCMFPTKSNKKCRIWKPERTLQLSSNELVPWPQQLRTRNCGLTGLLSARVWAQQRKLRPPVCSVTSSSTTKSKNWKIQILG